MFANKLVETLERLLNEKDKYIAELHQKNAEMEQRLDSVLLKLKYKGFRT